MERNIKIIITDILERKSFDIYNILRLKFSKEKFILTTKKNQIILCSYIYPKSQIEVVDYNFENDFLKISKKFSEYDLIYIPVEEKTTISFIKFINNNGKINFKFLLPKIELYNILTNKNSFNKFCLKNNFDIPKIISEDDFNMNKFKLPLIIKPMKGSGSRGIKYVINKNDLKKINIDFKHFFLQELVPNSRNVEAGFFLWKNGELINFYSHKRIVTYPKNGGVSVLSRSSNNIKIKKLGVEILMELNCSGLFMIEFLYDERDDRYKIIEINPRMWGSVLLSKYCNVSLIEDYINVCKNINVKKKYPIENLSINWLFPYGILEFLKLFINGRLNTSCFINITYSNSLNSFLFILLAYTYKFYFKWVKK